MRKSTLGPSPSFPSADLLAAANPRRLAHSTWTGGEFGSAFGFSVRVRGERGINGCQMRLAAAGAGHCVLVAADQFLELVSAICTYIFEYRHLVPFYPIFENRSLWSRLGMLL